MKNQKLIATLAVCLSLILPACGGGGGGGGGGSGVGDLTPRSSLGGVVTNLNAEAGTESELRAIAEAKPKLGSVTQSSHVGGDGTTLESIQLERRQGGYTVSKSGGRSSWTVDSESDGVQKTSATIQGIPLEVAAVRIDDSSAVAIAFATENADSSADYLSFGYWVVADFNSDFSNISRVSEFGLFVDGVEFSQTLPPSGNANYNGDAIGIFHSRGASGNFSNEFTGDVAFTAVFSGDSTMMSGGIDNIIYHNFDGRQTDLTRLRMNFESATFDSSGKGFIGGVGCGSLCNSVAGGSWGGQFFGTGSDVGGVQTPDMFGGTFGVNDLRITSQGEERTVDAIGVFATNRDTN